MSDKRNWLYECGRCEGDLYVKNLRLWTDNSLPCVECKAVIEAQRAPEGIACGDPPLLERLMLAYLTSNDPGEAILRIQSDADLLVAYLADDLEWTEHGGSVYGAWLTDDGREALAVLQARYPKETS